MENYQGDLADIFRPSAATTVDEVAPPDSWQFPNNPINYPSDPIEDFGDPFTYMGDPHLQNINTPSVPGFFYNGNTTGLFAGIDGKNNGSLNDETITKRPSNIFSRMLQISPNAKLPAVSPPCDSHAAVTAVGSPRVLKGGPPMLVSNNNRGLVSPSSSKGYLMESPQISSPRNTGIKRRKSQAKKVVCIPAPAPANSRSSGEVVPSDLWAWRKYGQKPIKGSPFPRGYYRCSSSKGCSARKQVERSRTDPNMLVITYTSEHNHPWPTQRNALAGSTRSQPSKTTSSSKNPPNSEAQNPTNQKQEQIKTGNTVTSSTHVKEEEMDQDFDNQLENMDDVEFDDQGFPNSYKPTLADSINQSEDSFFADLGEIEADPLDLLLTRGFCGDDGRENKDLDPFSFYDWATNNSNITASTTTTTTVSSTTSNYGEANRDS
ncbi:hypothetical protein DH2020_009064 [Rehmannia glutinosa]|uniref:WRKY domain-containing protein n=1 Tax=Rehmannia glutinosa TaxID=99300 RepID=A0ABR0X7S4_REHGL